MTQNPWAKFKPLKELPGIIRQASLIPETRGIGDLFILCRPERSIWQLLWMNMARQPGSLPWRGYSEEIVGDILDEYDEDEITIRAQKDNSLISDGLVIWRMWKKSWMQILVIQSLKH